MRVWTEGKQVFGVYEPEDSLIYDKTRDLVQALEKKIKEEGGDPTTIRRSTRADYMVVAELNPCFVQED